MPQIPNFTGAIPPPQSPLETYGKMLQMRALQGNLALQPLQMKEQQQRVQQNDLALQQQQLKLKSQQALIKAWSDPDFADSVTGSGNDGKPMSPALGFTPGFDPNKMIKSLVSQGVLPDDAMGQAASFLELSKNLSMKTKDDLSNYKEAHDQLAKLLGPITKMNVTEAGPALDAVKQKVVSGGIPGLDPQDIQLMQKVDLGHLNSVINLAGLASGIADFHKGQSEEQKAAAEATAAAQKVINPATGMSPEQEAEQKKQIGVETNPDVVATREKIAKDEAVAREQVQAQMLPILEQIRQQFGNMKDARDKIETTVLKPFQDKMTDITMARTAIAQALDNPVAARAAIFKMVGVAQPTGSHRVLPMEFTAFKYPGGITDQIRQKFNDFLTGEPWTPEIAKAANAFIDGQAGAAQRTLSSGIDNTNALFGTSVGTALKDTTKNTGPKNPESLTAAQISAYAAAEHVSEAEVKKQAKAAGINVPD